jgi:hypothetical protein
MHVRRAITLAILALSAAGSILTGWVLLATAASASVAAHAVPLTYFHG